MIPVAYRSTVVAAYSWEVVGPTDQYIQNTWQVVRRRQNDSMMIFEQYLISHLY